MALAAIDTLNLMIRNKNVLHATTLIELKKRYSGSFLGMTWAFLFPLLFLSVYLFLYLIVFKATYPNLNTIESIIYIFSGLVPYITFMEAVNTSTSSIKQNMHLIKNVILPVELIPIRIVSMAMVAQFVGLFMIFILSLVNHTFSAHLFLLPIALIIETFFLLGLVLMLAPLGVMLPDSSYFINILTLLLMFLSPIGFMAVMLPTKFQFVIDFNPIYYLIEPFRIAFLPGNVVNIKVLSIGLVGSLCFYLLGSAFFKKFKNYLADYE